MTDRKRLLLVGSGVAEAYRKYSMASIAEIYDIVLYEESEPSWQKPYIVESIVAPFDLSGAADALDQVLRRLPVNGVLTWDERRLELVAGLAERFNLRTVGMNAIRACRDKWMTREILASAGVPSARAQLTNTYLEAAAAAERIGFPVIVKPRGLAGSIGVQRVDVREDLYEAWTLADGATMPSMTHQAGVLIEEFLVGDEFSVECVTYEGTTEVAAVTRKTVGPPPYFEEVGHLVDAKDRWEPWYGAAATVAARALEAVGYVNGVSHVEVKVGPEGPRIIEINARLGGDLIPHLVALATGIDLPQAAASIAVGDRPHVAASLSRAAAIHFFYPPSAGIFESHTLGSWANESWVERCVWVTPHGLRIGLPPESFMGRLGFAVVVGDSSSEVRKRIEMVESGSEIYMSGEVHA